MGHVTSMRGRSPRKQVLVVEDEPDIATVLRIVLEQGYGVTLARDLASARAALARAGRPDLLVLDVWLPDGNGLDLCREVKAADPSVPVLLVSADLRPDLNAAIEGCGADAVLQKPFDPDTLESLVADLTHAA
jgi:two-component system OmpR family response regulator